MAFFDSVTRSITRHYVDPLDHLWIETASHIGLRVQRSPDSFASSNGRGVLALASADQLDEDDCVAQMVFHELCHSLVEGRDSFVQQDWGLDNTSERDTTREHACLRTQAALAARYGLRNFLAPTTTHRNFYDDLPSDPLWPRHDDSVILARKAIGLAETPPWAPYLPRALQQTSVIASAAATSVSDNTNLYASVEPPRSRHPAGGWTGLGEFTCGDCVWRDRSGKCLSFNTCVDAELIACTRGERALPCHQCGACCREGYDSVTVDCDDPVVEAHPELMVLRHNYAEVARNGTRCAALVGDLSAGNFRCQIYSDRPVCCRDLQRGGEHCLTARRRVGLSD